MDQSIVTASVSTAARTFAKNVRISFILQSCLEIYWSEYAAKLSPLKWCNLSKCQWKACLRKLQK